MNALHVPVCPEYSKAGLGAFQGSVNLDVEKDTFLFAQPQTEIKHFLLLCI